MLMFEIYLTEYMTMSESGTKKYGNEVIAENWDEAELKASIMNPPQTVVGVLDSESDAGDWGDL